MTILEIYSTYNLFKKYIIDADKKKRQCIMSLIFYYMDMYAKKMY